MPDSEPGPQLTDGPPRAALIAAVAVAVAAVVAVLTVAALHRSAPTLDPVVIPAAPAPYAAGADCAAVMSALPEHLGDFARVTPADPVPVGAAAWRKPGQEQPAVLRCGLDVPADFVVGVPLQVVNGVQWFLAADQGRTTWFTVDRPACVALTLPDGSGATPIQQLSDLVARVMPAVPIKPGPPR